MSQCSWTWPLWQVTYRSNSISKFFDKALLASRYFPFHVSCLRYFFPRYFAIEENTCAHQNHSHIFHTRESLFDLFRISRWILGALVQTEYVGCMVVRCDESMSALRQVNTFQNAICIFSSSHTLLFSLTHTHQSMLPDAFVRNNKNGWRVCIAESWFGSLSSHQNESKRNERKEKKAQQFNSIDMRLPLILDAAAESVVNRNVLIWVNSIVEERTHGWILSAHFFNHRNSFVTVYRTWSLNREQIASFDLTDWHWSCRGIVFGFIQLRIGIATTQWLHITSKKKEKTNEN